MVKVKKNKSNSEITSNSLFDFNDIKSNKSKKIKNENFTNNSDNNVSIINNIIDKKSKKNCIRTSKARKSNSNTTTITNKSKRSTKKTDKETRTSKTRISKTQKGTDKSNKSITEQKQVIENVKPKVGRKDRKHNWWNGCDYVWVDGIDHWVSKSAFRNEKGKEPVYSLNNYVQGLDSYWCLRYKPQPKKK